MKRVKCQLKVGPHYQCCCACVFQRRVRRHCANEPKRKQCVCNKTAGWVCDVPDSPLFENTEHSCGCEMFAQIGRRK